MDTTPTLPSRTTAASGYLFLLAVPVVLLALGWAWRDTFAESTYVALNAVRAWQNGRSGVPPAPLYSIPLATITTAVPLTHAALALSLSGWLVAAVALYAWLWQNGKRSALLAGAAALLMATAPTVTLSMGSGASWCVALGITSLYALERRHFFLGTLSAVLALGFVPIPHTFTGATWRTTLWTLWHESELYLLWATLALWGIAACFLYQENGKWVSKRLLCGGVTAVAVASLWLPHTTHVAIVGTLSIALATYGLNALRPRLRAQHTAVLGIGMLLLFTAALSSQYQRYQHRPRAYNALTNEASAWLRDNTPPDTPLFATARIAYNAERPLVPQTQGDIHDILAALMANSNTYVVTDRSVPAAQLIRTNWFQQRYAPVHELTDTSVPLAPLQIWAAQNTPYYETPWRPISIQAPNQATITSSYTWPPEITAGDTVYVALQWETQRPITTPINSIVRVVSVQDGTSWGQETQQVPNSIPVGWWTPDMRLPEYFAIATNPNMPVGVHEINVSLQYLRDKGSQTFVDVYQGEDTKKVDRVVLGRVVVPWQGSLSAANPVPIDSTFGEEAVLRGYKPTRTAESLNITLYWEGGTTQPPLDYTVFVQLVNKEGAFLANGDGPPMGGRYPTTAWQAKRIVEDTHTIPWPEGSPLPEESYNVLVGLYDPASEVRLPAVDKLGEPHANSAVLLPPTTQN